jgi:uncharacterized protein YpmB
MTKYLAWFVAFLIVIIVVFTRIKLVGSKKSESIKFDQETFMEYPMDSSLLPIHHFSTFDKDEITNVMECLENHNPEACIWMCDKSIGINLEGAEDAVIIKNKEICYQKNKVPKSYFADSLCIGQLPN